MDILSLVFTPKYCISIEAGSELSGDSWDRFMAFFCFNLIKLCLCMKLRRVAIFYSAIYSDENDVDGERRREEVRGIEALRHTQRDTTKIQRYSEMMN